MNARKSDRNLILKELRRRRDKAAAQGDHAEALIINDRVKDLKEGATSIAVERALQMFESGLARKRFYGPQKVQ